MTVKVLAVSGSLRSGSYNRKALQVAKSIAAGPGAEVKEIDLRELNIPIYDGDFQESGLASEPIKMLKSSIEWADLLIIASPEYNYGVSGALKNAIDWASRGNNSLEGKWAAIFGASVGILGTVRGQFQLRQILMALNVFVMPQPHVLIRSAQEAFNDDGSFKDIKTHEQLKKLIQGAIELVVKLKQ